jgi:hypothetical protein
MTAVALAITACARPSSAPLEASPGDSIDVAVGESVAVRGTSTRVLFVGANDSRCPSDVVCVTAGDAVIVLAFSGDAGARTDTIYLVRQPRTVGYGGFRFEAAGLNPYPKSTGPRPSPVLSLRILSSP